MNSNQGMFEKTMEKFPEMFSITQIETRKLSEKIGRQLEETKELTEERFEETKPRHEKKKIVLKYIKSRISKTILNSDQLISQRMI